MSALVHAKVSSDAGHVSEETAVAFYAALAALAAKCAPVTVDTLGVSEEKTARSLRRNGIISVALALVVVIFSGVTFVTVSMSKDITDGITRANELAISLRNQVGPPKPGDTVEISCGTAKGPPESENPVHR